MTETTIKFENMQEAEETYRIGDKFLRVGSNEVYMLVNSGDCSLSLVNINYGCRWSDIVRVDNVWSVPRGLFIKKFAGTAYEFKHLEHVEIVVKG